VLRGDGINDDIGDAKTPSLNPLIVSMLALPLLQILSLPQPATEQCDGQRTVRDCKMTAKQLLSVVYNYATQRPYPRRCHGDASTGSLLVLPSALSHSCAAYVHLARYLSPYVAGDRDDDDDDDDGVVGEWLQQVRGSLSADLQPSVLLTLLVTSIFLIRDDAATLDRCLQLLLAVCQSVKAQVRL